MTNNIAINDRSKLAALVATQRIGDVHTQRFTSAPEDQQSASWTLGDVSAGRELIPWPVPRSLGGTVTQRVIVVDRIKVSSVVADTFKFVESNDVVDDSIVTSLPVEAGGSEEIGPVVLRPHCGLTVYNDSETTSPESCVTAWWHYENLSHGVRRRRNEDQYVSRDSSNVGGPSVTIELPDDVLLGDTIAVFTLAIGSSSQASVTQVLPDDWWEDLSDQTNNCELKLSEHVVTRNDLAAREFTWTYDGDACIAIVIAYADAFVDDCSIVQGAGSATVTVDPCTTSADSDELLWCIVGEGTSPAGVPACVTENPTDWDTVKATGGGGFSMSLYRGTKLTAGSTGSWSQSFPGTASRYGAVGCSMTNSW